MLEYVVIFISLLCRILFVFILLRTIVSWFNISPQSRLVYLLDQITEPLLAPLRRLVPQLGVFDLTPLVAVILLEFVRQTALRLV